MDANNVKPAGADSPLGNEFKQEYERRKEELRAIFQKEPKIFVTDVWKMMGFTPKYGPAYTPGTGGKPDAPSPLYTWLIHKLNADGLRGKSWSLREKTKERAKKLSADGTMTIAEARWDEAAGYVVQAIKEKFPNGEEFKSSDVLLRFAELAEGKGLSSDISTLMTLVVKKSTENPVRWEGKVIPRAGGKYGRYRWEAYVAPVPAPEPALSVYDRFIKLEEECSRLKEKNAQFENRLAVMERGFKAVSREVLHEGEGNGVRKPS
jgi:hypothetical protein